MRDLAVALGTSPQNVSKHMGVLHRAHLVSRRKQGTYVYYAIGDASVFALCEQVCAGLQRQAGKLVEIVGGSAA